MRQHLMDFMSKELGTELHQLDPKDIKFGNFGWDSLKHVDMMIAIEEEFEIDFSMDELAEGTDSFNEILCLIEIKRGLATPGVY